MKKTNTRSKKTPAKKILSPHDRLFKKSLEHPQAAEHFIKHYLPKDILPLIKLNTLALQPMTFIENDLTSSACDVIFRLETIHEEKAYLYFLVEHQRKPDKGMAFRLLKYMIRLMDYHQRHTKVQTLPLVIPLVIYNGETRYPYSLDLFDLFDASLREKAKNTLFNPYPLVDLSQYHTDKIQENPWIAALFNALKYGAMKNISPQGLIEHLRRPLINLAAGKDLLYIETVIYYLNEVQPQEAQEALWNELQTTLQPILGENYMTSIAEALRQEGRQQGMQQGMQQGIEKVAKNLLAKGLDIEVVAESTGIALHLLEKFKEETKH